jgi:hypothetical protein
VLYLIQLIPMDPTIKTIVRVVVILAVVLWLLESFGVIGPTDFHSHIGRMRS